MKKYIVKVSKKVDGDTLIGYLQLGTAMTQYKMYLATKIHQENGLDFDHAHMFDSWELAVLAINCRKGSVANEWYEIVKVEK